MKEPGDYGEVAPARYIVVTIPECICYFDGGSGAPCFLTLPFVT